MVPILLSSLSVSESCGFTKTSTQWVKTASVFLLSVTDAGLPFIRTHTEYYSKSWIFTTAICKVLVWLLWWVNLWSVRSFRSQVSVLAHSESLNTAISLPSVQGTGFLLTGWWNHLQGRLPLWSLVQTLCRCQYSLWDGRKMVHLTHT